MTKKCKSQGFSNEGLTTTVLLFLISVVVGALAFLASLLMRVPY
jgi:hypothetical protein